jgi:hypothetical protein
LSLKHKLKKQKNRDATVCGRTDTNAPITGATRVDLDAKDARKAIADEKYARGTMKNARQAVREIRAVARTVPRESR